MDIGATLTALSQCLCETLEDAAYGHPKPCFCGPVPGTQVIPDMAEGCSRGRNGVAWVRLASSYPSSSVGLADTTLGNCSTGLGLDIEVGVVREHSAYYQADSISDAESVAITAWQSDDMLAIRRAIVCCDAIDSKDFILGMYQPIGPLGGLVGGAWMLHLGVL